MAKVTGIGGVFFLSKSEGKPLSEWYEKHLGMPIAEFGAGVLNWADDTAEDGGLTVWHVADSDSDWFGPSDSSFMVSWTDSFLAMSRQSRKILRLGKSCSLTMSESSPRRSAVRMQVRM